MADPAVDTTPMLRHQRAPVRGGVARRRRSSTLASDCANSRVGKGKLRAWGGWLPRETALEHLSDSKDTARALVDGGRDTTARREVR
jgi:hypothetical protein